MGGGVGGCHLESQCAFEARVTPAGPRVCCSAMTETSGDLRTPKNMCAHKSALPSSPACLFCWERREEFAHMHDLRVQGRRRGLKRRGGQENIKKELVIRYVEAVEG